MKEENCIILDFLPSGYADRRQAEPIAQAIGTNLFTLLELVPREEVSLKPEEEVYIGEGKREKIKFIKGQIEYKNLTNMSMSSLDIVIEQIVKKNEKRFVEFFNKAGIITPRLHRFQLLPGIGKKHLQDILEERKKQPFESFDDLVKRVKFFPDPVKTILKRVDMEIKGQEKYHLFTLQPRRKF